jgi:hypothetical protein
MLIVEHLTRMAHFSPCTKSVTSEETASLLVHGVYILRGPPRVLGSDRDQKFISGFLQTLWRRLGTRVKSLNMSFSRHPETDGLITERVSNMFQLLPRYFRCYDGSKWTDVLPNNVKFAYNATRALGIEHTPFEAIFGFLQRSHVTCCSTCDLRFRFRKKRQSG